MQEFVARSYLPSRIRRIDNITATIAVFIQIKATIAAKEDLGNWFGSFAFIFRLPLYTISSTHRFELISRQGGRLYFFCFQGGDAFGPS